MTRATACQFPRAWPMRAPGSLVRGCESLTLASAGKVFFAFSENPEKSENVGKVTYKALKDLVRLLRTL